MSETKAVATTTEAEASSPAAANVDKAYAVINRNVLWAMGAGFVPSPLLDLAGITAVQVKMLKELSGIYGLAFKDNMVRSSLAALISGLGSTAVGLRLGFSIAKVVPVVGQAIGSIALPAVAGATTYAVGRVYVMHFESGGTILDFDPKKMKAYFEELYSEGKQKVKDLKPSKPETAA